MELVNKDELIEIIKRSPVWTELDIITRINVLQTTDLVRCRECKHRHTPGCFRAYLEYDVQEWVVDSGDDDDFCSWGEREDK